MRHWTSALLRRQSQEHPIQIAPYNVPAIGILDTGSGDTHIVRRYQGHLGWTYYPDIDKVFTQYAWKHVR